MKYFKTNMISLFISLFLASSALAENAVIHLNPASLRKLIIEDN